MEIHIQLAGVQLGPYSEKQVRSYLDEGLLAPTDPARFEGTETWGIVQDVLGSLPPVAAPAQASVPASVHAVPQPPPPSAKKAEPEIVTPQSAIIDAPLPTPSKEVRKSSSITTGIIPRLKPASRDTIRVPIPQLAKSLAQQTTVARQAIPAESIPKPAEVRAPAPAPGQVKPSEKARTSLLTAVKILAKKTESDSGVTPPEALATVKIPSPPTVPLSFPKTSDTSRTMPMSVVRAIAKKADSEEKPSSTVSLPGNPKITAALEGSLITSKLPDPRRIAKLPAIKLPLKSPEAESKQTLPIDKSAAPQSTETSFITSKTPQTLRTAPMSMVRALPKKPGSDTTSVPKAPGSMAPSTSGATMKEVATAAPEAVRFVPPETGTEIRRATKAPHVAPEAVFTSKSLKRTTGSLPSLLKALEQKPVVVEAKAAPTPTLPPETKPVTDAPVEAVEEPSAQKSVGPLPAFFRSLGQKLGFFKSKAPVEAEAPAVVPDEKLAEKTELPEKKPVVALKKSSDTAENADVSEKKAETTEMKSVEAVKKTDDGLPKTVITEKKTVVPEMKSVVALKKPESAPEKSELPEKKPDVTEKRTVVMLKKPESAPEPSDVSEKRTETVGIKRVAALKKPESVADKLGDSVKKSAESEKKITISLAKPESAEKKIAGLEKKTEIEEKKQQAMVPPVEVLELKPPTRETQPLVGLTRLPPAPDSAVVEEKKELIPKGEAADVSPAPKAASRGLIFGIVALVIIAGMSCGAYVYVRSSYEAADALLAALKSGDQDQLQKLIDFPSLRKSLSDEMAAQSAQSTNQSAASRASILAMDKNSIEYYVTPEVISALAAQSNHFPNPPAGPTLAPALASAIYLKLINLPVKEQKLISPLHFTIDLDAAKLDMAYGGSGWQLKQIAINPDFKAPTESGAAAPPQALGDSLDVPVIETYLADGQAKFNKNDMDGAIADFSKVLEIDPKQTVAYSNRGMARKVKRDFDGAIADFNQAISLDPHLAEAYANRGDVKSAQKDLDGAIADYTQAVNLDPKLAGAFYSRGTMRTVKGDLDGAITDFTQDIQLDPNHASAYSNRGVVRQARNDLDGAIEDYTQALAIDPKIATAFYNRGLARQAKADLDGAISDYNHALDLDPKMTRVYYSRGLAKNTKSDLDGAIADYNQALSIDPTLVPALTDRALARQAKGDLKGALDDYDKALSIDPKVAAAYYGRGLVKEQLSDMDGAILDSSRAIDIDPKRAQAYYNRGFAKLVKGNLDGARDDLQKFCELAPRDPYADHARLYLWLIAMAKNPTGAANHDLDDALQNNWTLSPDDLVSKIASFLLDRTSEADLISAASSTDAKKDAGQHCEIWYFAGMKRLLSGDKATAIDYFRKCIATGQKDYCEYILAQAELQVLAPTP